MILPVQTTEGPWAGNDPAQVPGYTRLMRASYSSSWWDSMNEYPVWPPGTLTELGDYGELQDGCFIRMGHVREHLPSIDFQTTDATMSSLTISRRGTKAIRSDADLPAGISQVEFEFGSKAGSVLLAHDVTSTSVSNLNELAEQLLACSTWTRKWLFVTTVRTAEKFSVVIAKDATTKIGARGAYSVVEDFMLGKATAGAELEFSGDRTLQIVGAQGALSVQVHHLARFGGRLRNLGAADELTGVELVPYVTPVNDDPGSGDA